MGLLDRLFWTAEKQSRADARAAAQAQRLQQFVPGSASGRPAYLPPGFPMASPSRVLGQMMLQVVLCVSLTVLIALSLPTAWIILYGIADALVLIEILLYAPRAWRAHSAAVSG